MRNGPYSSPPKRILVVDDHQGTREAACAVLQKAGFTVSAAASGEEGLLTIARDPSIGLLITDIVMPNREGIETIREAKQRFPGIPIIAISGGGRLGPDGFLDLALKLGADDCLAKPFRPAELLDKVTRLLNPEGRAAATA